jgi:hypothetical protein
MVHFITFYWAYVPKQLLLLLLSTVLTFGAVCSTFFIATMAPAMRGAWSLDKNHDDPIQEGTDLPCRVGRPRSRLVIERLKWGNYQRDRVSGGNA